MWFEHPSGVLPLLLVCSLAAPIASAAKDASAKYRVLHSFCNKAGCPDGAPSVGGAALDAAGDLVGAGSAGPTGYGVVFRVAAGATEPRPAYARLHQFCKNACRDGGHPEFPLILDSAGNFYGTAMQGGAGGGGTVYEFATGGDRGKLMVLHAFCTGDCKTGFAPSSGLTYQGEASGLPYDGTSPLYGTTSLGGSQDGGTVYALVSDGGRRKLKALYNFCSALPCDEGTVPLGGLALNSAGEIFGIANLGGAHDEGAVFKLSPAGDRYDYSVIYSFCSAQSCTDGIRPTAGVAIDPAGNLYGTTTRSGDHDEGTAWELSPGQAGYTFQVIYQFCSDANCADGADPESPLTLDSAGNLFGASAQGGDAGEGTVFELVPGGGSWSESVLHSFCESSGCPDGAVPKSPLSIDASGNLYGTALAGGKTNAGVLFEVKP
jgi:uncharacterized repeat protein (TIGR03803 family)